jgi:hypothetical protein
MLHPLNINKYLLDIIKNIKVIILCQNQKLHFFILEYLYCL